MLGFLPDMAVRVMGTERHKSGMTLLFELLQQPRLNKQVRVLLTHSSPALVGKLSFVGISHPLDCEEWAPARRRATRRG